MRREAGIPKILIIPELRVLVLSKRHVGSGNEIDQKWFVKQNGVNKWRTGRRNNSGGKKEQGMSRKRIRFEENIYEPWLQGKLETTYSSTNNSESAVNLLSFRKS